MTNHFNSDFYITVATVIPVLFLAIVVQGPTYERMFESAARSTLRFGHHPNFVDLLVAVVSSLLVLIAFLIVFVGGFGEVIAIYTLYQGHDDSGTRSMVYLATVFLIIVAVAGPLLSYTRTLLAIYLKGSIENWKIDAAKEDAVAIVMGSGEPDIKRKPEADPSDTE